MITFVRAAVLVVTYALIAAFVSSVVDGSAHAAYPDSTGCEQGCPVAAGGWPVTYFIDYPGIYPVGAVSMSDTLLQVDGFRPSVFAVSFGFWLAVSTALSLSSYAATSRP